MRSTDCVELLKQLADSGQEYAIWFQKADTGVDATPGKINTGECEGPAAFLQEYRMDLHEVEIQISQHPDDKILQEEKHDLLAIIELLESEAASRNGDSDTVSDGLSSSPLPSSERSSVASTRSSADQLSTTAPAESNASLNTSEILPFPKFSSSDESVVAALFNPMENTQQIERKADEQEVVKRDSKDNAAADPNQSRTQSLRPTSPTTPPAKHSGQKAVFLTSSLERGSVASAHISADQLSTTAPAESNVSLNTNQILPFPDFSFSNESIITPVNNPTENTQQNERKADEQEIIKRDSKDKKAEEHERMKRDSKDSAAATRPNQSPTQKIRPHPPTIPPPKKAFFLTSNTQANANPADASLQPHLLGYIYVYNIDIYYY
jgi:hypothetical protein